MQRFSYRHSPSLENTLDIQLLNELVGADDNNQAHDVQNQVHCGGELEVGTATTQRDAVDVGGQHVAGGDDIVVVQVVNLVEVGAEQAGDLQDELNHDAGQNSGDGDVDQHIETVCAVDLGTFIQRGVDTGQRCQINDGGITGGFYDIGYDQNGLEQLGLFQKVNGFTAQGSNDLVQHTANVCGGGVFQEDLDQTCEDNPAQEVRQVNTGLHNGLDSAKFHLVDHQSQENIEGETKCQVLQIDGDGVLECADEVGVLEHPCEVIKTDPFASPDTGSGRVVLECQLDAVHRCVVEQNEIHKFFNEDLLKNTHNKLRDIGFKFVTLDLLGYRMGSMNEGIEQ